MHPARITPAGALLLLWLIPTTLQAQPLPPLPPDPQLLQQAGLNFNDGASLVDLFTKRTPGDTAAEKIVALVVQLADPKPEVRDPAFAGLVRLGPAALPYLRPAANDLDNLDAAAQARRCLQMIEGRTGAGVIAAAARQLAQLRTAGSVPALLRYLPHADDDGVAAEVSRTISTITVRDGKADPSLVSALEDPLPIRRIAAADALVGLDQEAHRPVLRKLLQDSKPTVRLRAALGLSSLSEEPAIPVLIDLLAELPPTQRMEAQAQLARIAGEWAITVPQGNDDVSRRLRKQAWMNWWQSMDAPTLLDEFRKRTLTAAEHDKILELIGKLGDETLATREQAMSDLVALGPRIVPMLRQHQAQRDPRVGTYVTRCLSLMESEKTPPLPAPAMRLVALRKPAGAVEVLLAFLPFAETEGMRQQVVAALRSMAVREGKVDPSIAAALDDKLAMRRLCAGEVLAEVGGADERKAVRKLLKDSDPMVRMRVGLALVAAQDRETIPSLIETLADAPLEFGIPVEEFLLRLAGDKAPDVPLKGDENSRKACRDAWSKWWKDKGDAIDLAKIDNFRWLFGQTLIVEQFGVKGTGRILELDARGKICWQLDGLPTPLDAQVLPSGRLLILENGGSKLTERDLNGKAVWERPLPQGCVGFQRLANGNTFIAMRHQIIEIDRDNKELFTYNRPPQVGADIYSARKLTDGQIAFVTTQQMYVCLDNTQKEVKSFQVKFVQPFQHYYPSNVEVLSGDHVLAYYPQQQKMVEYDDTGAAAWEAPASLPSHATRLSSGNTLVASVAGQRLQELDRAGRVVWEYQENVRPTRVHRR